MKNATLLLSVLASALLASCAGVSPTRIIGDTVGAAGGALIGNKLSNGNPLITAASAGGGVLLSETLQAESKASANKAYDAGYEKARSESRRRSREVRRDGQQPDPADLLDDAGASASHRLRQIVRRSVQTREHCRRESIDRHPATNRCWSNAHSTTAIRQRSPSSATQ